MTERLPDIVATVDIDAPPEVVWPFLVDEAHVPQWLAAGRATSSPAWRPRSRGVGTKTSEAATPAKGGIHEGRMRTPCDGRWAAMWRGPRPSAGVDG